VKPAIVLLLLLPFLRIARIGCESSAVKILSSSPEESLLLRSGDSMVMTSVPPGEFFFGSHDSLHNREEKPSLLVQMSTFWIDRFEVSRSQYATCQKAGACPLAITQNLAYLPQAGLPMTSVNWMEARTYCQWLGMDLPTEAQWEYALRGPLSMTYPWGNSLLSSPSRTLTAFQISYPVDRSSPALTSLTANVSISSQGVYSMSGNVSEWILDSAKVDDDGNLLPRVLNKTEESKRKSRNYISPSDSDFRIIKGAHFRVRFPGYQRGSFRRAGASLHRADTLGFRCAAKVPAAVH